jgi:Plasmid pRiA4b ORF-3-like protein
VIVSSDDKDELLRRFQAAISGMELADLRQLSGDLSLIGQGAIRRSARPDLRRPPLDEVSILRVRVDLEHADPPIWRQLDLRSDLTLDVVHQVLQVAFAWSDTHLHRFALGGDPFAPTSQVFLCPTDVEEADPADDGGIPARAVRLDEIMQEAGDVVAYVYDYGDSWELTLRLDNVLPAPPDAPSAVVVDGRRAAPPEDSGGAVDAESLGMVLDEPDLFDLNEINQALRHPYLMLREYGVDQRLVDLANRLRYTSIGEDFAARMLALVSAPTRPTDEDLVNALHAYMWFLDRAAGGIELTSAGYLKPADVEAASLVVPAMGDWIGKNNRETHAAPLLDFRQSLQSMGLLRKYKGKLMLTKAGAAAQRDPRRLWNLLVDTLVPAGDGFDTDATLLLLTHAASSADAEIALKPIAKALAQLGWQHRDGRALDGHELYRLTAFDTLINVSERRADLRGRRRISPVAATLARTALRPRDS